MISRRPVVLAAAVILAAALSGMSSGAAIASMRGGQSQVSSRSGLRTVDVRGADATLAAPLPRDSSPVGQYTLVINPPARTDNGCENLQESGTAAGALIPGPNPFDPCTDGSLEISNGGFGYGDGWSAGFQVTAPAGLTLIHANIAGTGGALGGGEYQAGWYTPGNAHLGDLAVPDSTPQNFDLLPNGTSTWGFVLQCVTTNGCTSPAAIEPSEIQFAVYEPTSPTIDTTQAGLYNQTGWVWNASGQPWSMPVSTSDPSGVCSLFVSVGSNPIADANPLPVDPGAWQQCPEATWSPTVDTQQYFPGTSGTLPIAFHATNAAQQTTQTLTAQVHVDNVPPSISLANSPTDLSQWYDHSVAVTPTATAGPSGLSGVSCTDSISSDGGRTPGTPSPVGDVSNDTAFSIDRKGLHTVTCTGSNNALNPQGQHNSGSASETIKIDEAPPAVAFEPQTASNPAQVVVDTSDNESGVQGGVITMTKTGTDNPPQQLDTTYDGAGHLIAQIPDSGLHGPYTFSADSCDNAGNCASTTEQLGLPLRLSATSEVSFKAIASGVKVIHKLVRIHGHTKRIAIVIGAGKRCATKRVKVSKHHWREIHACRAASTKLIKSRTVPYGHKVTLHGLLTSTQGAPINNAHVAVQTPVNNGDHQYATVAQATTGANGTWTATVPAGPSRLVRAVYAGSATTQAAVGTATISVPAPIRITAITPRKVPWGSTITIHGKLSGGYLPPTGALVELRYGVGHHTIAYGVKKHVSGNGTFTTRFTFGAGTSRTTFRFLVQTLPTGDYPYAPARSNSVPVTVGNARG